MSRKPSSQASNAGGRRGRASGEEKPKTKSRLKTVKLDDGDAPPAKRLRFAAVRVSLDRLYYSPTSSCRSLDLLNSI